ncbi:Cupin domain-containing protein [Pseudovibrio denitrificans]|uniref:Cupin domain-containing protein n=1 Tax=Pseudovibrio denitrificans TaxID=258256 RepID=A0A1I6Y9Q1_9HYPH|nr:cupin domain-containing protein [Pseudovibrio denitrificans]SFT47120.1 Cupin domain-containing protein [Pseudovibrio denitrificans]
MSDQVLTPEGALQGVTLMGEGINDNTSWNVVGHTYTPKVLTENVFIWHAAIPDGTFVPPHIHPTQDEWITVLTGELEVEFGEACHKASPGDTIRMPRGIAHGIFNRSGDEATCVFGVAPSRKLYDLFEALDGVTDPEELVRISALHEVDFLPPPAE